MNKGIKITGITIGSIIFVSITIIFILGVITNKQAYDFRNDAPKFIDEALHTITASWSLEEATPFFSQELENNAEFQRIFSIYSRLGKSIVFEKPVMQLVNVNNIFGSGYLIVGNYKVYARFEHDNTVTIMIQVVQEDGEIKINAIYITSEAFKKHQTL